MELNKKKLFVGGLSHSTTETLLREHFIKYGNIKSLEIIKNRYTGCNRGFGFVTFSDSSSSVRALADYQHVIMEKEVDVKIATPKVSKNHEVDYVDSGLVNPKRIFVGGLPQDVATKEFREYFESFGTVLGVEIPRNHGDVNKLRGFGYVTFDSEETVDNVLSVASHKIGDKTVEVQRATYPRKVEAARRSLAYDSCNRGLCSHEGGLADYPCCSCHCNGGMVTPMPYYVWWNGFWYYYPNMLFEFQDNASYYNCAYSPSSFNSNSILDSNGCDDSQESRSVRHLSVAGMRSCKGLISNHVLRINDKDKGCNNFNGVNEMDKGTRVNKNGYDGTSSTNQDVQFPQCIESALLVEEVGLKENGYEDQNGTCKNDQDELRVRKVGLEDQTWPM